LKGLDPLPTYPQVESKSSSSLSKIIWWVRLILKFLKIVFRREKRPQGIQEKKRSEVV